jgi:hypothetical protein
VAIKGYVDGVAGGSVLGWAHDPARAGARIELELYVDDELIGRCVADVARDDLSRAGIGDGRHGFRHRLPRPLTGGQHRIVVRALGDATVLPLAPGSLVDDPSVLLTVDPPRAAAGAGPPTEVLRGQGGWLFPRTSPEQLERAVGRAGMSPRTLHELAAALCARDRHLSELGVSYLLVTMPDKASVYGEHLPAGFVPVPEDRPAAALARMLRAGPRLVPLDLLAVLRDARRHGRVFARTGPQLTWLGAFHAYRAIVKELALRGVTGEPPPLDWLALGDLAGDGSEREPGLDRARFTGGRADLPTAAILHDGAGERLAPFLAEHFSRTTVLGTTGLPPELVQGERPAIVIQILADGGGFYA